MIVGTVAEIHRYPVKSMGGEALRLASVSQHGLVGDRAYSLFDPLEKRVASAKKSAAFPGLLDFSARYLAGGQESRPLSVVEITFPDGRTIRSDDPACVEALSIWFGRRVELGSVVDLETRRPVAGKYAMAGTFFDYAPLHIVTSAAVASLSLAAPRSTMAIRRFRPNLLVESSSGDGYPENEWVGRRLRIGDHVVVEITDPCPRCVMTTMPRGIAE